jgi:hypothetical protein
VKCSRCGAQVGAESTVCGECGTPVAEPTQPAAAQPPPSTPPAGQPYSPPTGQPYIPPAGPPYAPPAGPPYSQPGGPQPQPPFAATGSGWSAGAPYGPAGPGPARPGQNLKVIGGILAIVAALIVIGGSALPYVHQPTGLGHKFTSPSIFYSPFPGWTYLWFAAEPIVVALAAIVGGIMLLASRRDILVTIVAAMLTALGVQTIFLFAGYALSSVSPDKAGPGGGVGMLGGFALAAAGILALAGEAGYFRRLAGPQGP